MNSRSDRKEILNRLLFNPPRYSPLGLADIIVSLCGFYRTDNIDPEIEENLKKLQDSLIDYQVLDNLTNSLQSLTSRNFNWIPNFHRDEMPENLTISPTFNIGNIDTSKVIAAIEKIRNRISSRKIDRSILLSFIVKRASENGDLIDSDE